MRSGVSAAQVVYSTAYESFHLGRRFEENVCAHEMAEKGFRRLLEGIRQARALKLDGRLTGGGVLALHPIM